MSEIERQCQRALLMSREDAVRSDLRGAGIWPKGPFCVLALRDDYTRWANPDASWAERLPI